MGRAMLQPSLTRMTDTAISSADWWAARRLSYNVGLLVAGILAFVAYVIQIKGPNKGTEH